MPWLWGVSGDVLARVPSLPQGDIACSITFFLIDSVLRTIIALPWSAYSAFVVEQRHGFNKQTVGTFISDLGKKVPFFPFELLRITLHRHAAHQLLLGALLAPPILAGFVYLLQSTGPYAALYVWVFLLAVSLLFMTIYPTFIAPLFNKFDPLPEGELRCVWYWFSSISPCDDMWLYSCWGCAVLCIAMHYLPTSAKYLQLPGRKLRVLQAPCIFL